MPGYRILAFDGGGVRGVLTSVLLNRLETLCPGFASAADLLAGTSIGSIIAFALASGRSPAEVAELTMNTDWKSVFKRRGLGMLRPAYGGSYGVRRIYSLFPSKLRLEDLEKRVLAVSFRVTRGAENAWGPVFFTNFPGSDTRKTGVAEAAVACTAVPGFFPSHRGYIDGGVVANNPSLAAICAAVDPELGGRNLDEVVVMSLGTGKIPYAIDEDTSSWGALQWAMHPSPATPLVTLMVDGVSRCTDVFCRQLLGERYCRLDPVLSEFVGPDDHRAVPELIALAEQVDLEPVVSWIKRYWLE